MTLSVWCDSVDAAAIGKTQDTFDSVGTVTIKKGAKELLGVYVIAVNSGPTSGENGAPVLQVNSPDLGIAQQKFHLAGAVSDGIGTNDKEAPSFCEFIGLKSDAGKKLDGAEVNFALSGSVTTTEGWDVVCGLLFADGLPDAGFLMELLAQMCGRAVGGGVAYSRAGIKAATATAFTTGIKVTSVGKELIGLCGYLNPNAPTAKEACVGVVEFLASQITDFSPQRWPTIIGWGASLGTPIGTQVNAGSRNGVYYPTRFPLPSSNFTMDVSMLLATALTNEADGIAGARWR